MNLKIGTRQIDGVTVIDLSGRIVLGDETAFFRQTIRDTLARGDRKILLNLGGVPYIDSAGIGELAGAFLAVRRQGGELKLLNLTKKVHDVVQIVKLGSIFEICENETAALESFAGKPGQAGTRAA
ncbi:MAG: STAS domain-containing protein [Actinomycetota bacterium]